MDRLTAGDLNLAKSLEIPMEALAGMAVDPQKRGLVTELVKKAAFVEAINDAWALLAVVTLATVLVIPLARMTSEPRLVLDVRKGRVIVRRARSDAG
jgi:hypothetical protein